MKEACKVNTVQGSRRRSTVQGAQTGPGKVQGDPAQKELRVTGDLWRFKISSKTKTSCWNLS